MRCRSLPKLTLALATALLAAASPASAMSTYFGQNYGTHPPPEYMTPAAAESAFVGMLGAAYETETLDGFADKQGGTLTIFQGMPIEGWLTSSDDEGKIRAPLDHEPENRGFPSDDPIDDSSRFWKNETTSDVANELFRVEFSEKVLSFGFYATAWSTQSTVGATTLVLDLIRMDGTKLDPIEIPHSQLGNLENSIFYFGVISDEAFVAAALRNSTDINPGDVIGFDNFTVSTVPEPSTGLLLAAGLLGLAATGHRRSA